MHIFQIVDNCPGRCDVRSLLAMQRRIGVGRGWWIQRDKPSRGSDDICSVFGTGPCPQLPTVTQQVIEIAGLTNEFPEIVRVLNSVCTPPGCPQTAVNAVNGLAKSPPVRATDALWYLTPLAFTRARSNPIWRSRRQELFLRRGTGGNSFSALDARYFLRLHSRQD